MATPSLPRPSREVLDTKTFLLTVSTPGDLSQESIKAICAWIRRTTVHAYCVTERGKSDRLHLHAVMVFKDPRHPSKIRENVFDRMVKPHHPAAIGRVAVLCSVQYDHTWYDAYLRKETESTVHIDTYDRDLITDFFPTAAVQEALVTKTNIRSSGDPVMMKLVMEWEVADTSPPTALSALEYLKRRMYVDRNMVVVQDKRRLVQKAYAMYEYRTQRVTANAYELRLLTEQDATYTFTP